MTSSKDILSGLPATIRRKERQRTWETKTARLLWARAWFRDRAALRNVATPSLRS